ncbi:MAG: GTP cyclohydrolase I [Oscillospiraceae bacterium]|jgi:GTP cyclohydrolase I|nr:GTP cyclohydrolase I [Oscillospiraceae bacterium]
MIEKEKIKKIVTDFLRIIGENPEREGLKKTPERIYNMCCEVFCGNNKENLPSFDIFNEKEVSEKSFIVLEKIPFRSICEHHLLPFLGEVKIAYMPLNGRILGFSKFVRICNYFASRLQVQERLTNQIADFIFKNIPAKSVLTLINAEHLCMSIRGVKTLGNKTKTLAIRKKNDCDEEEFKLLKDLFLKQ